ncbi:Adenosine 5'-monophosphoramidase [Podila humilis]|nr:Adenosine 5'-monophosphoramidase [Podila humilis]
MHELSDESLVDILPLAKKVALAIGADNYNVLQNNGRIAHQEVDHVHFHVIPKPSLSDNEGLVIGWPATSPSGDKLEELRKKILKL